MATHHPAAFINAIAEEGSKAEAVSFLQKTWNENCELEAKLRRYRSAMENVCFELEEDFDTVDGSDGQPLPNKAMRLASELKEAIYGPGGF